MSQKGSTAFWGMRMVIEFVGTPGAGKTTLVPALIEFLFEREGIKAFTVVEAARVYAQRTLPGRTVNRLAPQALRQPLLWQVFYYYSLFYRFKFCWKHASLIWQVIRTQMRRPLASGVWSRRVLYWFFHLVGYYEFLLAHIQPDEALIFDEGFVHRVVQLNASHVEIPDLARIAAYLDLLPRPDLVILPRTPVEICEQRIYSRGLWEHFRHKSPQQVSQFLANASSIVNLTADYVQRKGWTVIEVNNGGDDLSIAVAELRYKLAKVLAIACKRPYFAIESMAI